MPATHEERRRTAQPRNPIMGSAQTTGSAIPSTGAPVSTPPATPPPSPGGQPGTPGQRPATNPPDPRPTGAPTQAPTPPQPPREPAGPQKASAAPQEQEEESGGGTAVLEDEPGQGNEATPDDSLGGVSQDIADLRAAWQGEHQALRAELHYKFAKTNDTLDDTNATLKKVVAELSNTNQSVQNLTKGIGGLPAIQAELSALQNSMAELKAHQLDPDKFKGELLNDVDKRMDLRFAQAAGPAVAAAVQQPTETAAKPEPAAKSERIADMAVSDFTSALARSLEEGIDRAFAKNAPKTSTPASAEAEEEALATPPNVCDATEKSAGQHFIDNINPFRGVSDLFVGIAGRFGLPMDAADRLIRNQPGMSLRQEGLVGETSQRAMRGAKTTWPWFCAVSAGVGTFKAAGGVSSAQVAGQVVTMTSSALLWKVGVAAGAAWVGGLLAVAGLNAVQDSLAVAQKSRDVHHEAQAQIRADEIRREIARILSAREEKPAESLRQAA